MNTLSRFVLVVPSPSRKRSELAHPSRSRSLRWRSPTAPFPSLPSASMPRVRGPSERVKLDYKPLRLPAGGTRIRTRSPPTMDQRFETTPFDLSTPYGSAKETDVFLLEGLRVRIRVPRPASPSLRGPADAVSQSPGLHAVRDRRCQGSSRARSWPQHPRESGGCRLNTLSTGRRRV